MVLSARLIRTLALALCLAACEPGGRLFPDSDSRLAAAPPPAPAPRAGPLDPLGEVLDPLGLGYRLALTYRGPDGTITASEHHGVDGLPLLVDVDQDPTTGPAGAEISVRLVALPLRLQVRRLVAAPLPLRLEAMVRDPADLLGLGGSPLRLVLGFDALTSSAPERFDAQIRLEGQAGGIDAVGLDLDQSGAGDSLQLLAGSFREEGGQHSDRLSITIGLTPVPAQLAVTAVLADDAGPRDISLSTTAPTVLNLLAEQTRGPDTAPRERSVYTAVFDRLEEELSLRLIDNEDLELDFRAAQPLAQLRLGAEAFAAGAPVSALDARLTDVPRQWLFRSTAPRSLSLIAQTPIGALEVGLGEGMALHWPDDLQPGGPFSEHALRIVAGEAGSRSTTLRLLGVETIDSDNGVRLAAQLASAPLSLRMEAGEDFTQARIEPLPATFELELPEEDDGLSVRYVASNAARYLDWRGREGDETLEARITPMPAELTLCVASDARCGSHGPSTDASLLLTASEAILLHYDQQRGPEDRTLIENLEVQHLAIDLGERSGFRKGYVFFDTNDLPFGGLILDEDPDDGFLMSFSSGTRAQDRRVTWKNYVQIDRRDGSMQCPGREDLAIKAGGRFYDADFVVDTLCQ